MSGFDLARILGTTISNLSSYLSRAILAGQTVDAVLVRQVLSAVDLAQAALEQAKIAFLENDRLTNERLSK